MNGQILIPHCRGRIAPLFDVSSEVIIFYITDGTVTGEEKLEVLNSSPSSWTRWLQAKEITLLICSAIGREYSSRIHEGGIEIIPGIRGEVKEVIEAWLQKRLTVQMYQMPGCRWKRRFQSGQCPRYRDILYIYEKRMEVDPMKIAVASEKNSLEAPMDPRFGRAQGFIIYNVETGDFVYKGNSQNLNAAQGAGIQSAKNVIDAGAGVLLSGHVGPKAFRALTSAGVEVFTGVSGTVSDAIEKYKSGDLTPAAGADVEGHW